MIRPRPRGPASALLVALAGAGCGYQLMTAERGPLDGRVLVIGAIEPARAADAPVASYLAAALPRELGAAGVPLRGWRAGYAAELSAVLEPVDERVDAFPRAPVGFDPPSATGRVAGAYALTARLRVRIERDAGVALWDGTVTAHAEYAESASLADTAAARDRAERDLAAALAARVREVLVR